MQYLIMPLHTQHRQQLVVISVSFVRVAVAIINRTCRCYYAIFCAYNGVFDIDLIKEAEELAMQSIENSSRTPTSPSSTAVDETADVSTHFSLQPSFNCSVLIQMGV
jgi:hypothetical protein